MFFFFSSIVPYIQRESRGGLKITAASCDDDAGSTVAATVPVPFDRARLARSPTAESRLRVGRREEEEEEEGGRGGGGGGWVQVGLPPGAGAAGAAGAAAAAAAAAARGAPDKVRERGFPPCYYFCTFMYICIHGLFCTFVLFAVLAVLCMRICRPAPDTRLLFIPHTRTQPVTSYRSVVCMVRSVHNNLSIPSLFVRWFLLREMFF